MLRTLDPAYEHGSLGYALIRRHWGNGYATEIARRLIEFGFGTVGFDRIMATCDPANIASAHVLTKAGMRQIAHLPQHRMIRGEPGDSLLFAVTRSDLR
jgi:RimJ/RimL family protein N-acetyltransferase